MVELISFFLNKENQKAFQIHFLQEDLNATGIPFQFNKLKENSSLNHYNLSLLKERMVLVPFKHWVEMYLSSDSIPQNVFWISQVSLDIYPHQFIEIMNEANRNILAQSNNQVCFLETTNIHGRVLFYFYFKEVKGIQQFNAHLFLVDRDFDFLVGDEGILNK
jgi:hypothetical protein